MAGRLLGALLVADPPEQTAEALAETLQASRGSISAMTRLLEAPGIIERLRKPGDRRDYFRNRPDAWGQAMQREAASMSELRALAEKGLAFVADAPPEARRGLEDMREFYVFFEREMPKLLERWEREHGRRAARARDISPRAGV